MSVKIPPPEFSKSKPYDRYKQELLAWREISDLAKKKHGIAVALSLPEDSESRIREKVFDELELDDLKQDDGLDKLINYLDKHLKKDDLADSLEKYEDFEDFQRRPDQSIADFISEFDQKYRKLEKLKITLPAEILAFKLIKRSNISYEEKMLVLTGMDYSQKATLYEQAQKSLKKFKSGAASEQPSGAIRLEPAFLAENEEALMAAGYYRKSSQRGFRGRGRGSNGRGGRGTGINSDYQGRIPEVKKERKVNPKGSDGKTLLCLACGSYRHMLSDCPDSWENMDKSSENVVLFTQFQPITESALATEARNCAVLDSACSSTVCGENWLNGYMGSLSEEKLAKCHTSAGHKIFRFGGGETLQSMTIPATIAGKDVTISTDVVSSDIPLLLSKTAMKQAKMKLDLENDTANIFGVNVPLDHTTSGHYCLPIDSQDVPVEVFAVKLDQLTDEERYRTILKLHRQFAHPPALKLKTLMQNAGVWKDEFTPDLEKIQDSCELCKVYKRTPPRPVVAMPMASRFNEKVSMDLKKWGNKWILHLIDMWSRFTVSVFINRKTPNEIIDKIMMHWIGAGFGVMESVFTDNGGEFSSEETREVSSILNIEVATTAADSPFQNGLCEKIHSVTDNMLMRLQEQCPNTPIEVLLCWANMARNSLQMWHGFSSYQLVFGKNPNLPNILTDGLPALSGTTTSEVLTTHLNALHAARKAFIESEAHERIRRALRSKVRASEQHFENGNRVYYKREGSDRWLGPAKVIFQDGKVIFIRHGGSFVRVSPNRVILAGKELNNQSRSDVEESNETRGQEFCHDFDEGSLEEKTDIQDTKASSSLSGTHKHTAMKPNQLIRYKIRSTDEWKEATILSRSGKATGQFRNRYNVKEANGDEQRIDLSLVHAWEKLESCNIVLIPRSKHMEPDCIKAKQVELDKLKEFHTYEEVPDTNQSRISTTWVLWQKGEETRARLVARGFEEETIIQTDSPCIGKSAMRIFLTIASSRCWIVKTTDIKSAFLQGKSLDRDVYLIPPRESDVQENYLWKLNHCIYGLNDAARQFYQSVEETLLNLGCEQSSLDPALFCWRYGSELQGMVACHIDDFLHSGSRQFDTKVMLKLRERFIAGKLEDTQFSYVGFQVYQNDTMITLDQSDYVSDIPVDTISPQRRSDKSSKLNSKEQTSLRSMVGRLNWAVQGSRPDMAFEMIDLRT